MSDAPWTPILDGEPRERALAVVRDIIGEITDDKHEDVDLLDAAGIATFLSYAAQVGPELGDGYEERCGEAAAVWLDRAVSSLARGMRGPGLWGGVSGIGFAVAHLAGGDEAEDALGVIDQALTETLSVDTWTGDYDLIVGLVGIGVYAIERGQRDIATRVLEHLEALAVRDLGGLAWFTPPGLLPEWQREICPDGYFNLGLAHGIPGVVGLMAHYHRADIEPARARVLLDGAVAWLRAAAPVPTDPNATARFPSWRGRGAGDDPGRLAWCYGDPGVALPLLLAARATGDASVEGEAIALARMMAARPQASSGVLDMGICHGAAGAAHLFLRLAHATHESSCTMSAVRWIDRTLAMRRHGEPVAGYPSRKIENGVETWEADPGMLTGASGVGLVLLAAATSVEPAWDRALLVDVSPLAVG